MAVMKSGARWSVLVAGVLLAVGAGGCSTFDQTFKEVAGRSVEQGPPPGIDGAWIGWWKSDEGHGGGEMRCLVSTAFTGAPDDYRAFFKARFWGFMTQEYLVMLRGEREGGAVVFTGEEDLGPVAGGEYWYEGRITEDVFDCSYRSGGDHGTFRLERVR